jgi:transposase
MGYKEGENREQLRLLPESIEDYVRSDNEVRVIDAYVDSLIIKDLGLKKAEAERTGRPPYSPQDLIKLYIYGYMNKIRSSRKLQKETRRNLELMWLLNKLSPDHVTIARFRSENAKALKNIFKDFVKLCRDLGLYGKELAAIDGSKFEALNSNDAHFNKKKLEERIKRLDAQIEKYLNEMNETDKLEAREAEAIKFTEAALQELLTRRATYETYGKEMEEDGETQKSITDPESRRMVSNGRSDMSYNVQSSVDSLNKLIVTFDVTNETSDINQLSKMANETAEILETNNIEVTADKGYDNASEVAACLMNGIKPHVMGSDYDICLPAEESEAMEESEAIEATEVREINSHNQGRCVYLSERNVALCPMGKILYPSSYKKSHNAALYRNGSACSGCQCKCTKEKYKVFEIRMPKSQFTKTYNTDGLKAVQVQVKAEKEKTSLRKTIVEHPFGTIKRSMDARYVLTKGITKVTGEFALVFLAYNLRRAINILGIEMLIKVIKNRHISDSFSSPFLYSGFYVLNFNNFKIVSSRN